MEENFLYNLKEPLEYTPKGKGNFEKTATVEFTPPNMKCFNEVSDFEQLFMGSLVSAGNLSKAGNIAETPEEEKSALQNLKDNVPKARDIRMMITMSQEIKITSLFGAFKRLACKCAKLDNITPIKIAHFEKLEYNDALNMLCEYASFFTFPSLLVEE